MSNFRILYVASEINPFLKTSEVADFVRRYFFAQQENDPSAIRALNEALVTDGWRNGALFVVELDPAFALAQHDLGFAL